MEYSTYNVLLADMNFIKLQCTPLPHGGKLLQTKHNGITGM